MRFQALVSVCVMTLSAACPWRAEAARVTGQVLAPDGRPVAGATVWVWAPAAFEQPVAVTTTKSNADGRYTLAYEPPTTTDDAGSLSVGAVADGFGATAQPVPSAAAPVDVTLRPECVLTVKLLNAAAGDAPPAGVAVTAHRSVVSGSGDMSVQIIKGPADAATFTARTDPAGVAVIRGLPQGARAFLDVDDERFARLTYDDTILLPAAASFTAPPTTLRPAATVRGRVTYGPTGEPAPGVRVSIQGIGTELGWGTAVTGPDGRYRVTRMPAGAYVASLHLKPDLAKDWTARAIDPLVLAPRGDTAERDFTLITGSLVAGHVRDDTGKGIAGVRIGLHGPARPRSAAGIQSATSAADGSYAIRSPAGEQFVYLQSAGPAPEGYQWPAEAERQRTVTTTDGQTTAVDFSLARAAAGSVVNGRVVDVDGRAISGATVLIVSDQQRFAPIITTDADGRFTLTRQPNDASFRLRARKGELATHKAVVPATDGSVTLQVRADALAGVTGTVVDAAGAPVAGVTVSLMETIGQFGLGQDVATTGADGTFAAPGLWPDGRYHLSATAPGFGQRGESLELVSGKTLPLAPLVIKRLDSFVAGTVFDADGEPVVDAQVTGQGSDTGAASVRTDAAGRFRVPTVAGDTLRLLAHVRGEEPQRFGSATAAAGSDRVTIVLEEGGGG